MQSKKQIIKNSLIFIILIFITFIVIFKNYDLRTTINLILLVDLKYIFFAIIAMCFYLSLESLNIKNILNSLGNNTKLLDAIKYTLIGFFFSGITPASGGGQPMEIYYMHKDKVPVTHGTIALLVELCSFHIITIIFGIIGFIINYHLMTRNFMWIFVIGITIKFLILFFTFIALFSKE